MSSIDEQFLLHARLIYGLCACSVVILALLGVVCLRHAWRVGPHDYAAGAVAGVLLFTAAAIGSMAINPFIASWFAPDYYIQQYRGAECAKRVMT